MKEINIRCLFRIIKEHQQHCIHFYHNGVKYILILISLYSKREATIFRLKMFLIYTYISIFFNFENYNFLSQVLLLLK